MSDYGVRVATVTLLPVNIRQRAQVDRNNITRLAVLRRSAVAMSWYPYMYTHQSSHSNTVLSA